MSDPWVTNTQNWLNTTYGTKLTGSLLTVDGQTGWNTMWSLTRALQTELGIPAGSLSNTFGPTTTANLNAHGIVGPFETNANIINILIGALYCKGYNAGNGELPGIWVPQTTSGVNQIQSDIGMPQSGVVTTKLFQAILTMDAYVRVGDGTDLIRQVQQWMNGHYMDYSWFSIIPADGSFSRTVQTMLVYAIQTELSVAGANGNFGPGTQAAIKAKGPITVGATDTVNQCWIRLFQTAMRFNGFAVDFTGKFSEDDSGWVSTFQLFTGLPDTGKGDFQTWCSLLVSCGDSTRSGTACDCVTTITPARAATLLANGYRLVGRYLTDTSGTTPSKAIQPGELCDILTNGMAVFPIFQTSGNTVTYFTKSQGIADAFAASSAASSLGFPDDTIIYFAVDCDPTGDQITSNVIPYYQGIQEGMAQLINQQTPYHYQIGVYGTRNVCGKVSGIAQASFVADMSTGFSGNLGFLMPMNWAFDQISTISVGADDGAIEIDNSIASRADIGQWFITKLSGGDDPYVDQNPQTCGLGAGAWTPAFFADADGTPYQLAKPVEIMAPDLASGGSLRIEVRYNQGYCWFRYNGGFGDHAEGTAQLLVDGTVILNSDGTSFADDGSPATGALRSSVWSGCSTKCGGSLVTLQYWNTKGWNTVGSFIAS